MLKSILVSNEIIKNKRISHRAFYLYILLQKSGMDFELTGQELLELMGWKDIRSLVKEMESLKGNGLVYYKGKITNKKKLKYVVHIPQSHYTILEGDTLNKVLNACIRVEFRDKLMDFRDSGVRLYYYLEMNYNEKLKKSFPSFKQIRSDTGLDETYINAIIKALEKEKIITVHRSGWNLKYHEIRKKRNNYILS
jgi:hypothetical protein